jgi:hypothetical protein
VLLVVIMAAGACQSEPSSDPDVTVKTYGDVLEDTSAREASEVAAAPSALEGTTVTVRGRISTVCEKKGCWLALDTGTEMPIRVLLPPADDGYEFTVPTALTGQATVKGTLRTVELDASTRQHLAEDGAAPTRAQEVQIVAAGIRVVSGT